MKKKIVIKSFFVSAIILLVSIAPVVCAENLNIEKNVKIITTVYKFLDKEEIVREVSEKEAQEIREDLEHLQQAFIEQNKQLIEKYESILFDKGIFGENHKIFSKNSIMNILNERYLLMKSRYSSNLSDENGICFVNARGKGSLQFMLDEVSQQLFNGGILLLLLLAFAQVLSPILIIPMIILLLGGLGGIVLAHLLPFRLLCPKLVMYLDTGNCTLKGLNGSQQYTAPIDLRFYWFNGITINFLTNLSKPLDLFLLGFAFKSDFY